MIDLTVHPEVLERTVERARERTISIPTFAQMRDPSLVPDIKPPPHALHQPSTTVIPTANSNRSTFCSCMPWATWGRALLSA